MASRRKQGISRTRRGRKLPTPTSVKGRGSHRAHHHMLILLGIAAVMLFIMNVALYGPEEPAQATAAQNVEGWVWNALAGWISMNDTNVGGGGGNYGVHVDNTAPYPYPVSGYAWSNNLGWICFGSAPTCPAGDPPGPDAAPYANVDASGDLHGWAQVLNLGANGWISLNCANTAICGASNFNVQVNFGTGSFSGWGWHGIGNATGWGWFNFDGVMMSLSTEDSTINPPFCADGIDNDIDGDIDCADTGCKFDELVGCPAVETNCALIGQVQCCYNGFDDDFDGAIDCADTDCQFSPACTPENLHPGPPDACTDGIDNDLDLLTDCDDPDCAAYPACLSEVICDDGLDDEPDGFIDCDDSDCSGDPACTPAWLKANFGNVYSTLGIEGNAPPPGETNATYCLSSGGDIINFQSAEGCEEPFETNPLTLPSGGTGYVSQLGRLDVNGILNGRYGEVVDISNEGGIQLPLAGKVYVYDADLYGCASPFTLSAKTWLNGSGVAGRGNGLLVIKGCSLEIQGDQTYQAGGVSTYLHNLASLGILVLSEYVGGIPQANTGNIYIDPSVSEVIGAMYAERAIFTGTTGSANTDIQLRIYGVLVSRQVVLERYKSTPTEPAELVEFDGRAVVNPPPGYQDISKSLPALTDTF